MMLPQVINDGLAADFEEVIGPTKNYKMIVDKNRVVGFIDEIEAMKQAIFLMLSVERYDHIIYSFNAGFESRDLFGKPTAYVASEVPRRIRDCLLQDDRILEVDSFKVTTKKGKVHVTYVAHTIFGEITEEREVDY